MELGMFNLLTVKRITSVGLYLSDGENDILLPMKYVPEDFEIEQQLEVFCYLDHEERPVATTLRPLITRGGFAALEVAEINQVGAFMAWGLEKHLLVPFREQPEPMVKGQHYVVYCYLDPKTDRLVASGRVERFLNNENMDLKVADEVEIICYRKSELGFEVIVNEKYRGLVFKDQVFKKLGAGTRTKGYVGKIREDKKLDILLEPMGYRKLDPAAERILKALQEAGGKLPLHDKSDPKAIQAQLQMSKKLFKKGVGVLYKNRQISLEADGIRLIS